MTPQLRTYTLPEVAEILKCCVRTVKNIVRRGDLRTVKVGRCTRVRERELERFLDRGMMRAGR